MWLSGWVEYFLKQIFYCLSPPPPKKKMKKKEEEPTNFTFPPGPLITSEMPCDSIIGWEEEGGRVGRTLKKEWGGIPENRFSEKKMGKEAPDSKRLEKIRASEKEVHLFSSSFFGREPPVLLFFSPSLSSPLSPSPTKAKKKLTFLR